MVIYAIVNQKGGVAKTTTTINLGSALAMCGKKVLIIDADPQANMTSGIGMREKSEKTIYDCLSVETPLEEVIYKTEIENLDCITADIKLANAEIEMSTKIGRESILKEVFTQSKEIDKYDYVFIDCNPSLGLLTINVLVACEKVIIPMEAAMFSFAGIEQLVKIINMVKKKLNNTLDIEKVLLTRVNDRTNLSKEFQEELLKIFKDKVFKTKIHQNTKIGEAQAMNQPVNVYAPTSKGAIEYKNLAEELISIG